MGPQNLRSYTISAHAGHEAFATGTETMLARLGYLILEPEEIVDRFGSEANAHIDLRIVDERRLGEVPFDEDSHSTPMIVLTGRAGATGADGRIVGAVKRPAGLHDLYQLLQQVFEETPRSNPRVATQLRAKCKSGDKEWEGRILSLSENGCLFRSTEPIYLGSDVTITIEFARTGMLVVEAEATYQLLPDTGLVFSAVPAKTREALADFVSEILLAA